jgi:hypothetical protein
MRKLLVLVLALLASLAARADDAAVLRGYELFREAEALRLAGEPGKALAAYDELLRTDPGTRFRAQAVIGRARCLAAAGERAAARKALRDLEDEIAAKRADARCADEASELLADLFEADGEVAPALERWRRLAAAAADPVAAARAKIEVERLTVAAEPSKCGAAVARLQALIAAEYARPGPLRSPVVAAAYLAEGDVEARRLEWKPALLAYLRVAVEPEFAAVASAERARAIAGAIRALEASRPPGWEGRVRVLEARR